MSEWPLVQPPGPSTCGLGPWRLELGPLTHIRSITVNYCLVPYDMLSHFSGFNIIRARQLFCDSGGVGFIDLSHILQDHSPLRWKLTLVWPSDSENKKTTQFTPCSRDVPVNLLQGENVISEIDALMQCLENAESSQSKVDGLYGEFCDQRKEEMKCKLDYKTVTISHGLSNKRSPGGLIS